MSDNVTESVVRPLVAVPGIRSKTIAGLRRSGVVAADKVIDAVVRAGGDPVILPPGDSRDVVRRLASFDAVVLPGGGDIDPSLYAAPADDRTEETDLVQDVYDLAVAAAAIELRLPLLAICRGMQVVNVALGGTLIQHVPDSHIAHRDSFHSVRLDTGSAVATAMGGEKFEVSSYHHQALDSLGDGLEVVGVAEDGCIEVVEHRDAPMLAVQWHPEDDAETARHQQALFDAVVDSARQRMRATAESAS